MGNGNYKWLGQSSGACIVLCPNRITDDCTINTSDAQSDTSANSSTDAIADSTADAQSHTSANRVTDSIADSTADARSDSVANDFFFTNSKLQ